MKIDFSTPVLFVFEMIILLSPAKTIQFDLHQTNHITTIPEFESEAVLLNNKLKELSFGEVKSLMKTSDTLTELTMSRILNFQNYPSDEISKPAVLAYMGAVYEGLQAWCFSENEMNKAQANLRILSGFYGILRPLDRIQAHRLEVGFKFSVNGSKDLYQFWSEKINQSIISALNQQKTNVVLNLASLEYSNMIDFKKIGAKVVSPSFKNYRTNEYKILSVYAKKARGMMASFVIKNNITNVNEIVGFDLGGYYYNPEFSSESIPVFTSEF